MRSALSSRALLPGAPVPIWIRTAGEGDVEQLALYFGKLSCAARYNRFMGAVGDLCSRARECLMPTRKSDFFTLVAEAREQGHSQGHSMVIGEASYGYDHVEGRGEFAISVIEPFQRHGLGSALLCALRSRAIRLGCRDLFGETLKDNEKMKSLARRAGFEFGRSSDWRAVRFDKHLAG
jgi:RimJ/RimL family protein N-acetyltransferase